MVIYIAHPIDAAKPGKVGSTLHDLEFFLKHKASMYFPSRPWSIAPGDTEVRTAIGAVNEAAQRAAEATLALLPDGVPTLGVPAEIERALQWGQPVAILVGPKTANSVQVAEWEREGAHVVDELRKAWQALMFAYATRTEPAIQVKLEAEGRLPDQAYPGDAGYDLYCSSDARIHPGQYIEIPCGFSMGMPEGYWGWLTARSSTARRGLLVNQAVIDQGYRGPMFVGVTNVGARTVRVETGERLAQLIPMPLCAADTGIAQVQELSESERGSNGFGSSGA